MSRSRRHDLSLDEVWLAETAETILAAGFAPELWSELVKRLADRFGDVMVALAAADRKTGVHIAVDHGYSADAKRDYSAHFGAINPWAAFWPEAPALRAIVQDQVEPTRLRKTEFFNDFLLPHGGDAATGIKLLMNGDRAAHLAVNYDSRRAEKLNGEVSRTLDSLSPFLHAALSLNRHAAKNGAIQSTLGHVLSAIACPAIVVNASGVMRVANSAGLAAIDGGGIVRSDPKGRIVLTCPQMAAELSQHVAVVCSGAIGGTDLNLRDGQGAFWGMLNVRPLSCEKPEYEGLGWLFTPERLALLLFRPRSAPVQAPNANLLRDAFGLTNAESRLAIRLASGERLEDAALAMHISKATVRSQLKQIFAKTDTHRQAELVALLSRLAGPAGT